MENSNKKELKVLQIYETRLSAKYLRSAFILMGLKQGKKLIQIIFS